MSTKNQPRIRPNPLTLSHPPHRLTGQTRKILLPARPKSSTMISIRQRPHQTLISSALTRMSSTRTPELTTLVKPRAPTLPFP